MTDAEAFQHIINVAKSFSDTVTNHFPETTDLKEVMRNCAKHIVALCVTSKAQGSELTTATAIVGMALLLNRKDQVDKITLVNATNVKD